jgi:hypothetical protein
MLGLAVVSALALMAFAGAGTASAVQVCVSGTSDGKCSGANEKELAEGGSVTGTSSTATLTSSTTDVVCQESSTTLKMTSANTISPITGEVTALSFSNCKTTNGTSCKVTTKNLPYGGSLTSSALTVTDEIGAGAKVECGFLINCEFTSKSIVLAVSSNKEGTAQFVASKEKLSSTGSFCPETAEWDATYTAAAGTTIS